MSKNGNSGYDFIAKLLIIGDSGVGKTCLLLRFCDNNFTTSHLATIGIDFKLKNIEVEEKKIRMQIWDTAGQERFKTITQTYYKGAMGIILTYAVNDKDSFVGVENWMKQIKQHANEDVCKILVGNKNDMPDRCITYEEGKRLADSYGIPFYETSAKDDKNVNDAFHTIAKAIKQKIITKEPNSNNNFSTQNSYNGMKDRNVVLNKDKEKKTNTGCC